jgi:hypothetical protein
MSSLRHLLLPLLLLVPALSLAELRWSVEMIEQHRAVRRFPDRRLARHSLFRRHRPRHQPLAPRPHLPRLLPRHQPAMVDMPPILHDRAFRAHM